LTVRFKAKEIRISGNTVISTEELLEDIPQRYNALGILLSDVEGADDPLIEDIRQELYDLSVIKDILAAPGEEREVSTRTMDGLTKYFLSVYQLAGYSGIYVYIPAEIVEGDTATFRDGVLVVEVLEATLSGDPSVLYKKYVPDSTERIPYRTLESGETGFLRDDVLRGWSPVKEGEIVNEKQLGKFTNLLNQNPDRYISAIVSRGLTSETLSLRYDVYERSPWHYYVQADNSGSRERRWSPRLGVYNSNLTGRDDSAMAIYQGPLDSHPVEPFLKNYSIYGSYDFAVFNPRLRMNLYAGHSSFDIGTDDSGGRNFLGSGDYMGGILRYNVYQVDDWFVDVTAGLSHEQSESSQEVLGEYDVEMDLWSAGVRIHQTDSRGMYNTAISFNRVESFDGSDKSEFELARNANAEDDFTIYTLAVSHNQYLGDAEFDEKIHRISGTFRYVKSDETLIPAKMTTFGGLYSVRGYVENDQVADGGILASVQYEFDLVQYCQSQAGLADEMADEKPWIRKLALVTFTDIGRAVNENPLGQEKKVEELASVGWGVKTTIGENFDGGAYYGLPWRSTDETNRGNGRWSFNLTYRW